MKHRIWFIAVAVLTASVSSSSILVAQERRKPATVDWMTQRPAVFSVVLQIERNAPRGGDRMIDAKMAAAVCESSAVVDPVLVELTQLPIEQVKPLVLVEAEPSSDAFVTLKVTLSPQSLEKIPADAGGKILDALAKRSAALLTKSAEAQMGPLRDQRDSLDKKVGEASAQLDQADAKYRDAAGRLDLTGRAGGVFDPRADLTQRRQTVLRDLGAARARLAAFLAAKPASQPAGMETEVGAISRQLSELREKKYSAVKAAVANGTATPADLDAANDQLLEAQLYVAMEERDRGPAGRSDRDGTEEANQRGEIAAQESQLKSFDEQIAALPAPSTQPANLVSQNDFQIIQNDRNEARNRLQQARQMRDSFDQQYGPLKAPTITPLTAEAKP